MRKDRMIGVRVPAAEYDALRDLATKQGITLTDLVKNALVSQTWRIELERNREYHREILKTLDSIEKRMKRTEKTRRKVITP